MAKFITVDTEGDELGQIVLNLDTIKKIDFVWHTLDDDNLTLADEADRRFYADKMEQYLDKTDEWVELYIITFCDGHDIKAFQINNKHFASELDLTNYLNNL